MKNHISIISKNIMEVMTKGMVGMMSITAVTMKDKGVGMEEDSMVAMEEVMAVMMSITVVMMEVMEAGMEE